MKRSSIWQKNLALNIVLGFFILLMLFYLLLLGLFIDKILLEVKPDDDPIMVFNGILLYYFGAEFFMRFFMQSLPTLNIETYLHLPVKKSSIVHYVAAKSVFVIGNYLTWLVVFPFAFKFFLSFATDVIQPLPSMKEYLSFVSFTMLAFGLVFELPLVIVFLARLGLVTVDFLRKNRKYAILLIFIVAAVLTPGPDVISQVLMAFPLMFLYEISIIGAIFFGKKKDEKQAV